jgi:uncharacterized protein (TIGR02001 family)
MRNDRKGAGRLRLLLSPGHGCALIAAVLAMPLAQAQLGGSVALVSDYSVRGMTLSQGHPEPQLRIDYDTSDGWYAGALAAGVKLPYSDASVQLLTYGGYARQLPAGLSWEAGALNASFTGGKEYRYHEFYAGLARDGLSARIYYSPAYYGEGNTLYGELNGAVPLRDKLTLTAHIGLLHPFGEGGDEARQRVDARVALGMDAGDLNLQIALVAATPSARHEAARKVALSATLAF